MAELVLAFQSMDIDITGLESKCISVGNALARNEQTRQDSAVGAAVGAHPCPCQCMRK